MPTSRKYRIPRMRGIPRRMVPRFLSRTRLASILSRNRAEMRPRMRLLCAGDSPFSALSSLSCAIDCSCLYQTPRPPLAAAISHVRRPGLTHQCLEFRQHRVTHFHRTHGDNPIRSNVTGANSAIKHIGDGFFQPVCFFHHVEGIPQTHGKGR